MRHTLDFIESKFRQMKMEYKLSLNKTVPKLPHIRVDGPLYILPDADRHAASFHASAASADAAISEHIAMRVLVLCGKTATEATSIIYAAGIPDFDAASVYNILMRPIKRTRKNDTPAIQARTKSAPMDKPKKIKSRPNSKATIKNT